MSATAQRERWRALLQRMLACARRSRETPLQFEIDGEGIATAALADLPAALANDRGSAKSALNEVIAELLGAERNSFTAAPGTDSTLGGWLAQLYATTRALHPSAIDIVAMRLEGIDDRAIAERLGLGLRMVQGIAGEMRAEWENQSG